MEKFPQLLKVAEKLWSDNGMVNRFEPLPQKKEQLLNYLNGDLTVAVAKRAEELLESVNEVEREGITFGSDEMYEKYPVTCTFITSVIFEEDYLSEGA